jgi:hypothetical protein
MTIAIVRVSVFETSDITRRAETFDLTANRYNWIVTNEVRESTRCSRDLIRIKLFELKIQLRSRRPFARKSFRLSRAVEERICAAMGFLIILTLTRTF